MREKTRISLAFDNLIKVRLLRVHTDIFSGLFYILLVVVFLYEH